MSIDATKWAWTAQVDTSTERLVLLSLADRAGEDHTAWPSMERLVEDTKLNLKTVKEVISRLIEKGFLQDTGKRVGKTSRVRILRLVGVNGRCNTTKNGSIKERGKSGTNPSEIGSIDGTDNPSDIGSISDNTNQSENGSIQSDQNRNEPENGMIPNLPANEPENGSLNEPEIGSQNLSGNLPGNLPLEKNKKNSVDGFLSEAEALAIWSPNLDNLNALMAEKNHAPVTPAELKNQIADFNRNNHGKGYNENQLYLYLRLWIVKSRQAQTPATPTGQASKPAQSGTSAGTGSAGHSMRQTDTSITKTRPFEAFADGEIYSNGFKAGFIRKSIQPGEPVDHCIGRLIREQIQQQQAEIASRVGKAGTA